MASTKARVVVDPDTQTVTTTFADGSQLVAAAVHDDESGARAAALGYPVWIGLEQAVWEMTRDHDRLHTLLAEAQGHPASIALWYAAHPEQEMRAADKLMAAIEERTVLLIQRLLNEGLEPVWAERG